MKMQSTTPLHNKAVGPAAPMEIPAKLKGCASLTLRVTAAGTTVAPMDQKLWQEIPTNPKRCFSLTSCDMAAGTTVALTDQNLQHWSLTLRGMVAGTTVAPDTAMDHKL
jgi:hypothetical protein